MDNGWISKIMNTCNQNSYRDHHFSAKPTIENVTMQFSEYSTRKLQEGELKKILAALSISNLQVISLKQKNEKTFRLIFVTDVRYLLFHDLRGKCYWENRSIKSNDKFSYFYHSADGTSFFVAELASISFNNILAEYDCSVSARN